MEDLETNNSEEQLYETLVLDMNKSETSKIGVIFDVMADTTPDMEILSWFGKAPSPEWLAQILMEISPVSGKTNWKRYALEVAELIGPDNIAELKRFVAFLAKVDEF